MFTEFYWFVYWRCLNYFVCLFINSPGEWFLPPFSNQYNENDWHQSSESSDK